MPTARRYNLHLFAADVNDGAIAGDQRAGRNGVRRAVVAADLIQHQLAVVVELNREPVPSLLVLPQFRAPELVIHPGDSAAPLPVHAAGDIEPCHRVVVRGVADAFRFHADAVLAVNCRRLA